MILSFFLGDSNLTDALVETMQIILKLNYFKFNGSIYHQRSGVAMGSPAAVVYANIFMFAVEEQHLSAFINSSTYFGRYIDDILSIQPRAGHIVLLISFSEEVPYFDPPSFIQSLNRSAPVSFTYESSYENLIALDMTMYRDVDNRVSPKTHFKAHNKFLYVHSSSGHPTNMWRALVKRKLLGIFRACSNRVEAFSHARFLLDPFYLRGYARRILEATYDEVVRRPPDHFFTRPERGIYIHFQHAVSP